MHLLGQTTEKARFSTYNSVNIKASFMEEIASEIVSLDINLNIKVNYNIIFPIIIIISVQCFKER